MLPRTGLENCLDTIIVLSHIGYGPENRNKASYMKSNKKKQRLKHSFNMHIIIFVTAIICKEEAKRCHSIAVMIITIAM